MPVCVICQSRFYPQTMAEPAERCECEAEVTAEQERDDPQYAADLRAWWTASVGKPIDQAREDWRNG